MKLPLIACLLLPLAWVATPSRAATNPEIESLGQNTYALTRWADNGFARNTDALKDQAMEDAAAYCAKMHKQLKVVSTTTKRPLVPLTGFAHAKVVFKALDADDPELHAPITGTASAGAPPATADMGSATAAASVDTLYSALLKLDDLRKRGLLTEEEFQAKRKKLVEESK